MNADLTTRPLEEIHQKALDVEAKKKQKQLEREKKKLQRERNKRNYLLSKLIAPILLIATVLIAFILLKLQ